MNQLYQVVGISKQAVHQYHKRQQDFNSKMVQLILEAEELRSEHPGCGVEKMYEVLKPDFIGRDRFIDHMMEIGFRLNHPKNYKKTTISGKVYYPNLIKGLRLSGPSQVWQSDITYFPINGAHYYGVFIIDVYTKMIVGYQVSDHLRASANVRALKMALKQYKPPEIHHSDRGSQYTYGHYVELLVSHHCKISMALCAQDNAYAERIHRTLKEEYLGYWRPKSFSQLKHQVRRAVANYNKTRPHKNLWNMSPAQFEQYWASLPTAQRPQTVIFNNEN